MAWAVSGIDRGCLCGDGSTMRAANRADAVVCRDPPDTLDRRDRPGDGEIRFPDLPGMPDRFEVAA